jgi:hypothetical protein
MPLINSFVSWMMKKRIHQMELFMKYPHEVQEELLKKLIYTARDTEWGMVHKYGAIKNINDFKTQVNIQNYDSLKPYIERVRNGEQNILWNTDIKWFAKSSGTTSDKSKYIPVSEEALAECHYKGGKDLLSIYCNNHPDTLIFNGKCLALGGSHQVNSYTSDTYYGDLSAILMQNLPFWAEFIRTPGLSIALMDKWEDKIDMLVNATVSENVTNISGVPTWTIVLAKRIMEVTGRTNLLEVWPNLELFVHGAVSFVPYHEQMKQLMPPHKVNCLETYNASEGFFGIQDMTNSDELLLMLDYGIYYEFMPMEEYGKEHPKTLQLSEVQRNVSYVLVISTNAGLWRYIIGDTITFTSMNPYRIKITGRTKHFINAFGEELIIDNAEKSIAFACTNTGAIIKEYTAAPIYFSNENNGGHEWLIEFEKEPDDLIFFTDMLDKSLQSLNSDYEAKRQSDIALKKPLIKSMPENTFYNWLKAKGKLGGQHKVPRLSNDRRYVDEILEFANAN